MIMSMTGFGRAAFTVGADSYTVEIKTLNHRHLDVKTRLPERFFSFDLKVRELVRGTLSRGSVTVSVSEVKGTEKHGELNMALVKRYLDAEMELKHAFGVEGDVDVKTLLGLKEIFTATEGGEDSEEDWEALKAAVAEALAGVVDMRKQEGKALGKDIKGRLKTLEKLVAEVAERVPEVNAAYRSAMEEKMKALIGAEVDEQRLLTEAAIFSDKGDIAEELTRFAAHVERTREYLAARKPVGRKLDFLCQELNREANTMASKSNDVECSQTLVEVKGELEKVREQVQNIE